MRLTRNDLIASLATAAAGVFYLVWLAGGVTLSTRVAALVVFALGWVGCTSAAAEIAHVYGVRDAERPPVMYATFASALGAIALVAGVVALVAASKAMLATLVICVVTLWLLATVRHVISHRAPGTAQPRPMAHV